MNANHRRPLHSKENFSKGEVGADTERRKASATWMAIVEQHAPITPMTGPIELTVFLTWQRKAVKTAEPKTTRPDLDNCAKLLLDAMTKAGYWKDDAQICRVTMEKFQGARGWSVYQSSGEQMTDAKKTMQPRVNQKQKKLLKRRSTTALNAPKRFFQRRIRSLLN